MSIVPDKLYHLGGVAVGSSRDFEGWWGGETFFVDYDNGTTGVRGDEMGRPQKHLRIAINNAGADSTIYVRPRAYATGTYGEDPQEITPDTAASWVITSKKNLSLIGTGKGLGHASAHKCWIGNYGSLTTAVLTIYSPGCVIENFRADPGSSTTGIFYSINSGTATYDGGNTTFINNDFHDAGTAGGIRLCSTWQMSIVGNRFVNNDVGILCQSLYSVPQIFQIWDNTFAAATSEVQNDIYFTGGVKRFVCRHNYHTSGTPALGGTNVYIKMGAASTGAIMDSFFGADDTTESTVMTLNGLLQGGNLSQGGIII